MRRRSFLSGLAALSLLPLSRRARADGATRLKYMAKEAIGTTFCFGLDNAPFPTPGSAYTDDTVLVFVPAHFRYRREEGVPLLVHFHGHNTTAERALTQHELHQQLADSKQNALLVVPALATMAADSACGKLESAGGLTRLLAEAVEATAEDGRGTLGSAAFPRDAPHGTVCISAHSGGYHAAASCIRVGGLDIRETYLFDSLYAEHDVFRDWTVAGRRASMLRRHKLISYFTPGGATESLNGTLRADLEHAGVLCALESQEGSLSRHELSHVQAVFVRTDIGHSNVTWENNALRDCLFASALPRHLRSTWFAREGARPLEPRQ
ncbi:MAG: hypothetical protein ABTD50_08485 [Polyangiaceae bacterium]|jgi:hypothetical protein